MLASTVSCRAPAVACQRRRARQAACRCAGPQYRRPRPADSGRAAPHQPHRTSPISGQCAYMGVTASWSTRVLQQPSERQDALGELSVQFPFGDVGFGEPVGGDQ